MHIILFGIPNCETVKKARNWLETRRIDYQFHDFKKHGAPREALTAWVDSLGWEAMLNRRGTTWRGLDAAAKASVCDAVTAVAAMQAHPSLIKRPIANWNGHYTAGFDALDWDALAHRHTATFTGRLPAQRPAGQDNSVK